LRIHLVDARSSWGLELAEDLNTHFESLIFILHNYSKQPSLCFNLIELTRANYLIHEFAMGLKGEDIFYVFIENTKVQKEWDRSYLKDQIEWFIIRELKNLKVLNIEPDYDIISSISQRIKEKDITLTEHELLYLHGFFTTVHSNLMDLYTLSRIFKIHNVQTDNHPDKSRNIILYAGKQHAINISKFIRTLKRTTNFSVVKLHEYSSPDENLGCVLMKNKINM
jgi:hypothetical protein